MWVHTHAFCSLSRGWALSNEWISTHSCFLFLAKGWTRFSCMNDYTVMISVPYQVVELLYLMKSTQSSFSRRWTLRPADFLRGRSNSPRGSALSATQTAGWGDGQLWDRSTSWVLPTAVWQPGSSQRSGAILKGKVSLDFWQPFSSNPSGHLR